MHVTVKKYANMKVKLLAVFVLVALAAALTVQLANAQTNIVTGSLSSSSPAIVVHNSVTLTCTYTSTSSTTGTGKLWISGPYDDPSDPDAFDSYSVLYYWDGGTGTKHGPLLTSGVPVTFTKTLDTSGYYKFKWECSGGGVDGAYVETMVRVVDDISVLPEAPPVVAVAASFVAIGVCVAVVKKKGATVSTKLLH